MPQLPWRCRFSATFAESPRETELQLLASPLLSGFLPFSVLLRHAPPGSALPLPNNLVTLESLTLSLLEKPNLLIFSNNYLLKDT